MVKNLKIKIVKNDITVADISLPAISAKWISTVMSDDIIQKITEKGIDLKSIEDELKRSGELVPQVIFELISEEKNIKVWLE